MGQYLLEVLLVPRETTLNLFISLVLSLILSLFIALVYRKTHRSMSYEASFISTLVLIAPIIALVMFFIRGDLVLSLGLIGSLSIIRFRTPIKDTRDMIFLFWAIVVGLGCGTNNWVLVLFATLFMAIVASILYILEYGTSRYTDFILVVSGIGTYNSEAVNKVLKEHAIGSRVRSHEVKEEIWEAVFELRFSKIQEQEANTLIGYMKKIEGVERVSLLAPQLALPM